MVSPKQQPDALQSIALSHPLVTGHVGRDRSLVGAALQHQEGQQLCRHATKSEVVKLTAPHEPQLLDEPSEAAPQVGQLAPCMMNLGKRSMDRQKRYGISDTCFIVFDRVKAWTWF